MVRHINSSSNATPLKFSIHLSIIDTLISNMFSIQMTKAELHRKQCKSCSIVWMITMKLLSRILFNSSWLWHLLLEESLFSNVKILSQIQKQSLIYTSTKPYKKSSDKAYFTSYKANFEELYLYQ